ncbi:MAG TPA: PQQ-dependent sugar dehydrogenase, partial [Gammaproteobacteria bacterium]
MSIARSLLVLSLATLCAPLAHAQREVPFRGGIPIAPSGLADKPLGDGPFDYATGEGQNIRVTVLTKALSFPFTLTFLPDGTMLIAQRDGKLRVMRGGKLDPNPVAGGPASFSTGTSGLPGAVHGYMDIALHPQFAQNQTLYLSYTKPLAENRTTFAVARARWTGSALADLKDVFVAEQGDSGPTPIAFGRDGMLYIATSGGNAQDGTNLGG